MRTTLSKERQAMLLTLLSKMSPEDQLFVHDKLHSKIATVREQAAIRARKRGAQRRRVMSRIPTDPVQS